MEAQGLGHIPDQWVAELEAAWGIEFEAGYTPDLPIMSHLWERLRCNYR
jgi:hypothetical protein